MNQREDRGNVEIRREEMAANHQTISITVSGLAELAHSEYQVRERKHEGENLVGWQGGFLNLLLFSGW